MITITAKHVVREDQVATFKDLAKELIKETHKEEGFVAYNLYEDIKQPNTLTFIEQWKNQAALDSHMASAHFKRLVPKLTDLLIGKPEFNLYKQVK